MAGNPDKFSTANSTSFKYKSSFFKPLTAADNEVFRNVKLTVSLKYLSNFWRSLEMPWINCKIHLDLIGVKTERRNLDNNSLTRFPLDASFQGAKIVCSCF